MRQLLVLAAALAMILGLHALSVTRTGGAFDPLTLAAIGFVVLAAFTVGQIGARIRVPRISGYIISGILLGPQVFDILSRRVVSDMQVFNTLALGLIATTAGLELDVRAIRKVGRTLVATVVAKVPLLLLMMGGAFVAMQSVYPILTLPNQQSTYALAIVLAIFGIGTSPAIALAVTREAKARGRLTDLVLAIAVVKDLVVVVALAVGLAVARSLVLPDVALDAALLLAVAKEIGASIAVGAAVGGVFIASMRFLRLQMLLFIVAAILLVAELSRLLHLELLLVFIVAGFTVRNLSEYEHELLHSLERVALPVFVVFFTTSGANVDLRATVAIAPLAAVLALARALAFYIAGRVAARLGQEPSAVGANAWMAYLPQAGVTLGLVLLAAKALGPLGDAITQSGMALVSLHLLIGPLLLSFALRRSGEAGKAGLDPSDPSIDSAPADDAAAPAPKSIDAHAPSQLAGADQSAVSATSAAPQPDGAASLALEDEQRIEAALRRGTGAPELDNVVVSVGGALARVFETLQLEHARRVARAGERVAQGLLAKAEDQAGALRSLRRALVAEPPDILASWESALAGALEDAFGHLQAIEPEINVALDANALTVHEGDGLALRWRKRRRRFAAALSRRARVRRVPAQRLARVALEPRLAEALATAVGSWFRCYARMLRRAQIVAEGQLLPALARQEQAALAAAWCADVGATLRLALRRGLLELSEALAIVGAPARPTSTVRYSLVEGRVRAARRRVLEDGQSWRQVIDATFDTLRATAALEATSLRVDELLDRRVRAPLESVTEQVLPLIASVIERLEALAKTAASVDVEPVAAEDAADGDEATPAAAPRGEDESGADAADEAADERDGRAAAADRLLALTDRVLPRAQRNRLRSFRARYRRSTHPQRLRAELGQAVESLPTALSLFPANIVVHDLTAPGDVAANTVNLLESFEKPLIDELLPLVSEALTPVSELVAGADARLRETVHGVQYAIEFTLRAEHAAASVGKATMVDALGHALARAREQLSQLDEALTRARDEIEQAGLQAAQALRTVLDQTGAAASRVSGSVRATRHALAGAREAVVVALRSARTQIATTWQRLAGQRRVRDYLIRAGQRRLDAVAMRRYLEHFLPPAADQQAVPPLYSKLFTAQPLEDRRLFVAHRDEADQLVAAVANEERDGILNVLIVGAHGSGRTSLLNVSEVRFTGQRVLQIESLFHPRAEGLLGALAAELNCSAQREALVDALTSQPTVVVIDDLEHHIDPSPAGVAELQAFLDIMVETAWKIRWIVTTEFNAFAALNELVPLAASFGRLIELHAVDWRVLRQIVEGRQRLAGTEVQVATRAGAKVRWWRRDARERYFRALGRASHGNLRSALELHLRTLRLDGEQLVADMPERVGLPFIAQLPPQALAILALVVRFGPLSHAELRDALGADDGTVERYVLLLEVAELLARRTAAGEELLRIPAHVESLVTHELSSLAVAQTASGAA